jgi:hypothetical protein
VAAEEEIRTVVLDHQKREGGASNCSEGNLAPSKYTFDTGGIVGPLLALPVRSAYLKNRATVSRAYFDLEREKILADHDICGDVVWSLSSFVADCGRGIRICKELRELIVAILSCVVQRCVSLAVQLINRRSCAPLITSTQGNRE